MQEAREHQLHQHALLRDSHIPLDDVAWDQVGDGKAEAAQLPRDILDYAPSGPAPAILARVCAQSDCVQPCTCSRGWIQPCQGPQGTLLGCLCLCVGLWRAGTPVNQRQSDTGLCDLGQCSMSVGVKHGLQRLWLGMYGFWLIAAHDLHALLVYIPTWAHAWPAWLQQAVMLLHAWSG